MTADDIREVVASIWPTTPEIALLACIAWALAEILELLTKGQHRPCND
jgi:hypothetical protein